MDGTLYLVDGWHRVAAAIRRGEQIIDAVITDGTLREARWLAASANLTHGLPLTRAEKRRAFNAYVETGQHRDGARYKSYGDIWRELAGIARTHSTIRNWMREDHPKVARAIARAYNRDEPEGQPDSRWGADHVTFRLQGTCAALANFSAMLDGLPVEERRAQRRSAIREPEEQELLDATAAGEAGPGLCVISEGCAQVLL